MDDASALDRYLDLDELGFFVFDVCGWLPLGATEYVACARRGGAMDMIRLQPNGAIGEFKHLVFEK